MFTKSLQDFIDGEIEKDNQNKVLLIDGSNLIFRTLFIAAAQVPEDTKFNYWKYLMIHCLLNTIKIFEPNRVIFAMDGIHYWRKDIYPQYKAHRKQLRDKSVVDFGAFFKVMDSVMLDIKSAFSNIFFLRIDNCEADDIIAIICKEKKASSKHIIVATDNDFLQLLTDKNIEQFDPIKRKNKKCINPQRELDIKCIIADGKGNKGDGIPSINPKKNIGPKTALKIIKDGLDKYLETDNVIKENFKRNKQLIDFNFIPKEIKEVILKEYNGYSITPINGALLWQTLLKNNIKKIAEDLNIYLPCLKKLNLGG